ncbi:heterokaryon incompatibility protein-domain-containing protein [Astrocystis sublimbata]|nr:heterokaryon incompatibility protein-domain-containing protein [Astrocystis sublimbata]
MRFLDTTTLKLHNGKQGGSYAILSHRWLRDNSEEVSFEDLKNCTSLDQIDAARKNGLDKIRRACAVAKENKYEWLWVDTCCIDKGNTQEYSEAINSMFAWYRQAGLCIAYLSDVEKGSPLGVFSSIEDSRPTSNWFTRGWTLQELLAPQNLEFFDRNWKPLGKKKELADAVAEVSGIDAEYHTGEKKLNEACIAVKMSWLSRRETTYEEDRAYCMIGLFNISMPFVYGERGPRAFRRLQEIILTSPSMDESIFAWEMPTIDAGKRCGIDPKGWGTWEWGLLAGSPDWFRESGDIQVGSGTSSQDRNFRASPKGIEAPIRRKVHTGAMIYGVEALSIVVWPGLLLLRKLMNDRAVEEFSFTLNCFRKGQKGKPENVEITLQPQYADPVHLFRVIVWGVNHLDIPPPYIECKRIKCNELSVTRKSIHNHGQGIVFQPKFDY